VIGTARIVAVGTNIGICAIPTSKMEPFDAIYQDDVVFDWPQSGEVIRGKHNVRGASPRAPDSAQSLSAPAPLARVTSGPSR
jgi:hypothetical protein